MIINIRGTSGSGKTHLVRSIIALYPRKQPMWDEEIAPGRRNPLYYLLDSEAGQNTNGKAVENDGRRLAVVGSYESVCGGCDTIAKDQFNTVYKLVRKLSAKGYDVLYEGLLLTAESARALELHNDGFDLHVVALTTSLEECLGSIGARREARGKVCEETVVVGATTFSMAQTTVDNVRSKMKGMLSTVRKLREAGVSVHDLGRDTAFAFVSGLLGHHIGEHQKP